MLVSWRRPREQHGLCLPCALCSTCLCLLSVPPTLCFGMLYAVFKDRRRARSSSSSSLERGRRPLPSHSAVKGSSSGLSLEGERRLWLRALLGFFGDRELRDVGPLVWRFLDDQPCALLVADSEGRIQDLPLHGSAAPRRFQQVMGEVLGLLPGKVVSTLGHMLVLEAPEAGAGALRPETCNRTVLGGHLGDVTCFAAAAGGGEGDLVATGSTDMTVRLWQDGRCLRAFAGQEWSEWTGTMYIGHVTTVSAVLVTPEGRLVSGDRFGAVCVWREDGGCEMLDPPCMGAVTCLTAGLGDGFLVGHAAGDVRAASWDVQLRAAWSGAGETLLAVAADVDNGRVLAASSAGFSQAVPSARAFSRLAAFVEAANAAHFEGGMLIICGRTAVSLWALDGRVLATVLAPEARAATLLYPEGRAPRPAAEELREESTGLARPSASA